MCDGEYCLAHKRAIANFLLFPSLPAGHPRHLGQSVRQSEMNHNLPQTNTAESDDDDNVMKIDNSPEGSCANITLKYH